MASCFIKFNAICMRELRPNPLFYVDLPAFCFDCWLKSSVIELDTLKDSQMVKTFKVGNGSALCGIMGDREDKSKSNNVSKSDSNVNSDSNNDSKSVSYSDSNDRSTSDINSDSDFDKRSNSNSDKNSPKAFKFFDDKKSNIIGHIDGNTRTIW